MWNTRLSELEFDADKLAGALEAIESSWITAGPRTKLFEAAFAEAAGTEDAVAVSNGTAALFLTLKALGIGPGDEVLCPSMTFVATAAAVLHCGAKPVFVDIKGLGDPTMDPEDAARKVGPFTRAILPVHYAGIPCDMSSLTTLARSKNLLVVEDAAHAPGAVHKGRPCGSLGTAGCFSLFGNKNITTGEGGVITTSDHRLAERLRLLRSHGMTTNSWDRDRGRPARYDVIEVGFNFRFDDIRAALGLAQLRKLNAINSRRAEIVSRYNDRLSESRPEVILPFTSLRTDIIPSYHIYPIVLPSREERDALEGQLKEEGIQTSIHYRPIHNFSAIRTRFPDVHLPVTETFGSRQLTLPLYPSMTPDQVDAVAGAVARSISNQLV